MSSPRAPWGRTVKPPASQRVTIGKIGCGGQGSGLGGCGGQVVAACDAWKDRRERWAAQTGGKAYRDFRELLARADIDAVVVATPDHWHVPVAVAAAKAGKDMYVEKPLGVSIYQDQACREAVHRYGRVFQYGTQQRSKATAASAASWSAAARSAQLKEIIVIAPNSGPGGNAKPLPVPDGLDYDMWLGPAPWTPYTGCPLGGDGWYHCYDYALGFIAGWGAHPLDILVWGYDTHRHGPWEVEGTGIIPTQGRHDAIYDWNVRITLGQRRADDLHARRGPHAVHRHRGLGRHLPRRHQGRARVAPETPARPQRRAPDRKRRATGQNFIDAVRSRATPVSNIDDAVHSDIISHVSDIAIRLGRKLTWDPAKEQFPGDAEANRMLCRAMREPWGISDFGFTGFAKTRPLAASHNMIARNTMPNARTAPDKAAVDKAFQALQTFDWGQDRGPLRAIDDAIVATHGDAAARKDLESRLLAVVTGSTPRAAKDFALPRG